MATTKDEDGDLSLDGIVGEYATDLELSLFAAFSEPDKAGKASAGFKYKLVDRLLFILISILTIHLSWQRALSYANIQSRKGGSDCSP